MVKKLGYAEESIEHCRRSQAIKKFLVRKGTASPSSAKPYSTHLTAFAFFIFESYQGQEVDGFIESIKQGKNDPYDILAEFAKFLRDTRTGENTLGGTR